jgi:predicted phosphoribosyltransferase
LPVAPAATVDDLRREADVVVCLSSPAHFRALGDFYHDFGQLSDADVLAAMKAAGHPRSMPGS